ncbi:beta-1,3-galactosyltransferase pvg3-like protein [Carex littledalei]|uniref:Hexosyltransferase n=1 Tax=Carex littledalei TaxID=544730 RepID=A0A833R3P8_9POAL|nr:beta-1,3-galactosyltransferase pvg3-like protein [Carex littledalei]
MATRLASSFWQQNVHLSIILPLSVLAFTFLILMHSTKFRLPTFFASCHSTIPSDDSIMQSVSRPDLRILVGVLTTADSYERRQLIRLAYSQQRGTYHHEEVDVRFVFCSLSKEEQHIIVALEIMQYNDIIILNCTENMNKGKTYDYFSSVPTLFRDHPHDYVMKCDDDTYLRLGNLVESLRNKSRVDVFYGLVNPCYRADDMDYRMNSSFMSGLGYLLSWDLTEWIAESEIARNNTEGPEDIVLASWLNTAKKGRNRYHNFPTFYDYKGESDETCFRHDFIPETIAIHMLKGNLEWARTLNYFNATKGLKPSHLYHV